MGFSAGGDFVCGGNRCSSRDGDVDGSCSGHCCIYICMYIVFSGS
jgi:hypothetical protein